METLRPPSNILTAILRPPSNIPSGPCSLSDLFSRWFFCCGFFPSTQARCKSRTFGEPFSDCKHGNFPYYSPYSQSRHAIFWRLLAWDCIPFRVSFLSLTHSWTYDSIFVFGSFFCSCCLALNIVFFSQQTFSLPRD